MADNTQIQLATTGDTIATDDIGSVKYQRVKLIQGADGVNNGDVSSSAPLQVTVANTGANSTAIKVDGSAVTQPISGTIALSGTSGTNIAQVAGAAPGVTNPLFTRLTDGTTAVATATTAPGSSDNGLVVRQIGTSTVTVSGTVTVGSHAVTNAGTFVVQVDGSALTALQLIDDSIATIGSAVPSKANAVSGTDGTNARMLLTSTTGALQAEVTNTVTVGSHAVTNAGTFAVQAAQSGTWNVGTVTTVTGVTTVSTVTNVATIGTSVTPGTSASHLGKADDAAHASGDTGVFALAVRSDTAAATGQTDGDYTALVTDSTGRLWCNVSNTVTVAAHAVTNAGTFAVQESGTHIQVDDAAFTPATSKVMMIGAEYDDTGTDSVDEGDGGAVRMSANRNLFVRVRDNAGNERGLNIDSNGEVQISGSRNAVAATGDVANDAVDSGSPQKVGGLAKSSVPTAVADADRVNALFDLNGRLIVRGAPRQLLGFQTAAITTTDETTIVSAQGSGVFADPYLILIGNSSTTAATVTIKSSSAGATVMAITVPGQAVQGFSGQVDGALPQPTANLPWTATSNQAVSTLTITTAFVKNS